MILGLDKQPSQFFVDLGYIEIEWDKIAPSDKLALAYSFVVGLKYWPQSKQAAKYFLGSGCQHLYQKEKPTSPPNLTSTYQKQT